MLRNPWPWLGAALTLLGACAPTVFQPLPGVELPLPRGRVEVPTWVLPGNPLPLSDDFERYPVGAVLTGVAPERYGLLAKEKATFTVVEALDPKNAITRAVRLAPFGGALLTTGAGNWTDYQARFDVQSLGNAYWGSAGLLARVFLDPAGTQGLEFRFGRDGIELTKVLGEQRRVVAKRPELKEVGEAFVRDKLWHRFEVLARSTGEVRFRMDGRELLAWQDPDFRQGGLGFGVHDSELVLYLDNLEVTPLSEPSEAP